LGDHRRVAYRRRQQHLYPDRTLRADRFGLQECDPDRGIRTRAGISGPSAFAGGGRSGRGAAPADSSDEVCPYSGRGSAGVVIMGVVPLVLSSGAGAEMRHAMGVAVFFGMLGVTFFGLFLTPVFYLLLRSLTGMRPLKQHGESPAIAAHALGMHA